MPAVDSARNYPRTPVAVCHGLTQGALCGNGPKTDKDKQSVFPLDNIDYAVRLDDGRETSDHARLGSTHRSE